MKDTFIKFLQFFNQIMKDDKYVQLLHNKNAFVKGLKNYLKEESYRDFKLTKENKDLR